MKLISSFNDYYDSVARSYHDSDLREHTYIRELKEIIDPYLDDIIDEYAIFKIAKQVGKSQWNHDEWLQLHIIGFCGELFPLYIRNIYTIEPLFYIQDIPNDYILRSRRHYKHMSIQETERYIRSSSKLKHLFYKYKTPIFIVSPEYYKASLGFDSKDVTNCNIILNPCLRYWQFERIIDPYTAYQRISQFVSNNLVEDKTPQIPVGSDKELAESKGFDKWSFRKLPSKK